MEQEIFDHRHPEVPRRIHLEIPEHEQRLEISRWWVGGFLSPILAVLFTIFWVFMSYWLIGWRSRDWEFGTVPYVPGQSYFTSYGSTGGKVPDQVEMPPAVKGRMMHGM